MGPFFDILLSLHPYLCPLRFLPRVQCLQRTLAFPG